MPYKDLQAKPSETRICKTCGSEMACYWNKGHKSKYGYWVYRCQHCAYKKKVESNNQPDYKDTVKPPKPDEVRYCQVCSYKMYCSWHKDHRCKAGGTWVYRCIKCVRKRQRARYPDYYTNRSRRKNCGVTDEQYNAMNLEQGGLCAICKHPQEKGLYLDHNHSTGYPRALLCQYCNTALGFAFDDPARLRAMADYLEYWQAKESEGEPCQIKKTA